MAKALQRRRGTHGEHQNFTGLVGEFTYDTTEKRIVAHDGATKGGIPMAKKAEVDAIDVGVTSFNGTKGAVTYSAPVSSVNGQTGAVTVNVGVTSFNGSTGAVTYLAPVTSVNGQTGAVTITVPTTPKAYVTETWKSGEKWYRKWSDGWVEQGGRVYFNDDSHSNVLTFPIAFSDTNYTLTLGIEGTSGTALSIGMAGTKSRTATGVVIWSNVSFIKKDWYACGY